MHRRQPAGARTADARVRRTTELSPDVATLLRKLRVPAPPKLHAVTAVPDGGAGTDGAQGRSETPA
ncbi:MAG: hypothetical protein IT371_15400 [Deltaproteobacteria bacterium]|nr:hypothetical protein [Deltaproteobacteria bacterium]